MYAVQAQISVKDMFVAGIIPGIILVIALAIMGIIHTLRHHPQRGKQIEKNDIERLKSLKNAAGDLALPVIILLLYFGGITTLVETGAVAVVYSIVLEVVIYRKLKLTELAQIIKKTAPVIGGVLMIVAMAKGLSYFIVDAEVPMLLTDFFSNHVSSPINVSFITKRGTPNYRLPYGYFLCYHGCGSLNYSLGGNVRDKSSTTWDYFFGKPTTWLSYPSRGA